ncbi:MAG: hypothetical protein HQK57_10660 [Deltaproteobacteria bacterium]|nr:hypothetical protein [Deltaproteobacteria bacterium]
MAEIKSTLDLVMERTKGMVMTPEEKERQRQTNIQAKARGLLLRFLDSQISLAEIKKEIQAQAENDRGPTVVKMIRLMFQESPLVADGPELIIMLGEILDRDLASPARQLQDISNRVQAETLAGYSQVRQDILDNLAQAGISGSAVDPWVEDDQRWLTAVKDLTDFYSSQVITVKKEIDKRVENPV